MVRSTDDRGPAAATDAALVQGVLEGDHRCESEFLERIVPHLRAVAAAILIDRAEVDDAVQVALMRVLKGLSGFRGDSSLVHWARRVATHACLRFRERNQRRLQLIAPVSDPEHVQHQSPADPGRLTSDLDRYLSQLPLKQREVLVLRHVLEYSVREIAELVDAPVDTVKSRLLYGRRALRVMLEDADAERRDDRRGTS